MAHAYRPVLITDAAPSQEQQLRSREIRYVVMMGVRMLCLVVAGVLVWIRVPMLAVWVSLCVVGVVVLPWLAVLLANDGPPKPEHRLVNRPPLTRSRTTRDALAVRPEAGRRVIDVEP